MDRGVNWGGICDFKGNPQISGKYFWEEKGKQNVAETMARELQTKNWWNKVESELLVNREREEGK